MLQASASSGLPVTFTSLTPSVCSVAGNQLSLLLPGTCTVAADQAGNAQFEPAPTVQQAAQVVPALQVVIFGNPGPQTLDFGAVALSAVASSGLPVSFSSLTPSVCSISGNSALLLQVGLCTVQAEQPGNTVVAAAAPVVVTFAVGAAGLPVEGDVPLPPWALLLMGAGLWAVLRRRGGHAAG
jgi:hypothetical protein